MQWAILTGEYPPQAGGVSDYTRLLARGLAAAGDEVHIWAPSAPGSPPCDDNIRQHRLAGAFGPSGLVQLDAELSRLPRPFRLLVQYVPHAFGFKGMNVPFCLWLRAQRRRQPWVMFHEVAYYATPGQPRRRGLLAAVTRLMARLAVDAAARILVSTPGWEPLLRGIRRSLPALRWLPIPSNLPVSVPAAEAADIRRRVAPDPSTPVVGSFGTFSDLIAPLLRETLPTLLLTDPRRVGLLSGRGSETFRAGLVREFPLLAVRLHADGDLPGGAAAARLAACDLLVQPFPDGVSSRRTSVMAGLALGRPIATNTGFLTEPVWGRSACVALAASPEPRRLVAAAEAVLGDVSAREALGRRAGRTYRELFALEHTIAALRRGD